MKKIISLSFGFLFGFIFLCAPQDSAQAFYYDRSTTKKMPPYTLVEYGLPRSEKYAISPNREYARVYLPYAPVQYDILRVDGEQLVEVPLSRGVATFQAGEVRYWPSWIGVPPWWN